MEASEKAQLPLDEGAATGSVRAIGDRLVIEQLTVTDSGAARVVREQAEQGRGPAETVGKAIEIGTRVIDNEGTAANVDYVRRELQTGLGELNHELAETLADGNATLAERIAATFGADRSDSVQQQIKQILAESTKEQREALMRMFAAEDGSNPLVAFQVRMTRALSESDERHRQEMTKVREGHATEQRAMRGEISGLREQFARLLEKQEADDRVAEEVERGTAKGRTFEELVHTEIDALAAAQGDAAHHVGDASSEAGGKKGDTVVELGACTGPALATVVFEAKNRKLSKNDAWIELNAAMAERDADYGVLVVAGDDKIPSGLEELTEYQGNKMIAVLDREQPDALTLRLIYRYVRARVLAAGAVGLEVDAAGVRDAAEEAAARLKATNRIRKSLTNVTNSAGRARIDLDEMVADVERCLARIESLVAAAGDAQDAASPE
jgi:hypothetical protein